MPERRPGWLGAVALVLAACAGGPVATGTGTPSTVAPSVPPSASFAASPVATPASTVGPPSSGRIAYIVDLPEGGEVHLLTFGAGGGDRTLALGGSPSWSPDGHRIAMTCPRAGDLPDLCIVDLTTDPVARSTILQGAIGVTWSPDGEWLAVVRSPIDVGDTWLVRPDGSGVHEIKLVGNELNVTLWSPDSRRLAGVAALGGARAFVGVCDVEAGTCRSFGAGAAMTWSPDGDRVGFVGSWEGSVSVARILDLATGAASVLIDPAVSVDRISWAPDGRIAVVRSDRSLVVLDGPGGVARPVAEGLLVTGQPAWSPDGVWLVVRADLNALHDLFAVRSDGSGWVRLTTTGTATGPLWAPVR